MPCNRFETGKLDRRSSTSTRVEFILSRTVCVTILYPKSLHLSQIRKVVSTHYCQNSTVKQIQLSICLLGGSIKASGCFSS